MDLPGFHVFAGDAVIADERVGKADELAAVGGIREDFLVAGHARVEDDLAAGFEFAGEGLAFEGEPVFKSQKRFHNYLPSLL